MTELAIPTDPSINLFDGDSFGAGYSLPGYAEVDKAWLQGVPHIIVRATYWVPTMGMGMVSLECHAGTAGMFERAMRRGKIPSTALAADGSPFIEPEEPIVYSDGGTGIRRQITKMLQTYGLIDVGHDDMPEQGLLGECRYDTPWIGMKKNEGWKSFSGVRMQGPTQVPSIEENHLGEPLRINVKGGLCVSDYSSRTENGSITYYLR